MPARVNLAGGWTDTPPYTLERCGEVLNFAVGLGSGGGPCVTAEATLTLEPGLHLVSVDGTANNVGGELLTTGCVVELMAGSASLGALFSSPFSIFSTFPDITQLLPPFPPAQEARRGWWKMWTRSWTTRRPGTVSLP